MASGEGILSWWCCACCSTRLPLCRAGCMGSARDCPCIVASWSFSHLLWLLLAASARHSRGRRAARHARGRERVQGAAATHQPKYCKVQCEGYLCTGAAGQQRHTEEHGLQHARQARNSHSLPTAGNVAGLPLLRNRHCLMRVQRMVCMSSCCMHTAAACWCMRCSGTAVHGVAFADASSTCGCMQ